MITDMIFLLFIKLINYEHGYFYFVIYEILVTKIKSVKFAFVSSSRYIIKILLNNIIKYILLKFFLKKINLRAFRVRALVNFLGLGPLSQEYYKISLIASLPNSPFDIERWSEAVIVASFSFKKKKKINK